MPGDLPSVHVRRYEYALDDRTPFSGEYYPDKRLTGVQYDMHFPLELDFVLRGRWRREYGGWGAEVRAGQVSFCGMWERHGVASVNGEDCDVFVLMIWPALVANLYCPEAPDFNWLAPFTVPARARPQVPESERGRFLELGRRFVAACREPPSVRMIWFRLLLMEALLDIARFWRPPRPLTPARSSFAQLNPAIDAVLRSGSLISTQTAARSCGMNRMQFSRSFQATMGLSFADFSRRHRLDAAVHRMLAGREPIKAIARATGFCDESHFCRMFIRYYHCTPREYRLRYGAPG